MLANVPLLKQAHWHRRRRHYRKAAALESLAFDGTDGPINGPVVIGAGHPIERLSDALWMAGAGATIICSPAHRENVRCK